MPTKKPVKKAASRPVAKSVKAAPSRAAKLAVATSAKPAAEKRAASSATAPVARRTLADVLRILEKAGSEKACTTYARHGAKGPMFGVLFGDLFKLMKEIDVDHELARQLWATGNVDARNLAMKIADPQAMTPEELDRWAVENPMRMCGLYIATLAAEGPHARAKLRQWLGSSDERLRAMGWTLLGRLSDLDESCPEEDFLRGIDEPPEVMRSLSAFLRDRSRFDPSTWDADRVILLRTHIDP